MVLTKRKILVITIVVLSLILATLLCILMIPEKEPEYIPPTTEVTFPTLEANPLSPEDFVYENGFLTCLTAETVLGIDVSSHQREIDWNAVKAAGVEFVMIRVGYRGTDQGGIYEDEYAKSNYEGAKHAGLLVGAYFFSQATTTEEALEEANFTLSVMDDWELDMPLVFDWEYSGEGSRVATMVAAVVTECAKTFCQTVNNAGFTPMVYFNTDIARYFMYLDELSDYPFWLAMYDQDFIFDYKVDMWQYTSSGSIPGIEGNVDINLYFP